MEEAGMDEMSGRVITDVLDGLDEVTERFGEHLLANGSSVKENNRSVLSLLASLSKKAAEPESSGRWSSGIRSNWLRAEPHAHTAVD